MVMTTLVPKVNVRVSVVEEGDQQAEQQQQQQVEEANKDNENNGFLPQVSPANSGYVEEKVNLLYPSWKGNNIQSTGSAANVMAGCFDDPLVDEAERRSVLHYDLCYKNECTRGQLTFSLRYDYIHRMLMMHLVRANNIQLDDGARLPNAYVKAYLLPERHHYCRSKIWKRSSNPEFNEVFSFDAPVESLASRMLQLTVYDYERIKRHDIIGNVIMRDLLEKSDLHQWTEFTMHIVDNEKKDDYGDILLYVNYDPCDEKLVVNVDRAYNLRPMDITGASDPYVKIIQLHERRRVKKKRTSIKRANLHPMYNEALTFDVPKSSLTETNLLVKVMDWDRIGRDDLLGCCIIGPDSVTAQGREQWSRCVGTLPNVSSSNSVSSSGKSSLRRKADADSTTSLPTCSNGKWHSLLSEVPPQFARCSK